MNNEIKYYYCIGFNYLVSEMFESSNGDWVKREDYESLKSKFDALNYHFQEFIETGILPKRKPIRLPEGRNLPKGYAEAYNDAISDAEEKKKRSLEWLEGILERIREQVTLYEITS